MNKWKWWYSKRGYRVDKEIISLIKILKWTKALRILDFGCGNGRHTIYFAKNGFQVYGFDVSKPEITKLERKLKRMKLHANLRIWNMNNKLPYKNNVFDAVISTRVIHHTNIKNIRKIAKEIYRITKSNGYIYIEVPSNSALLRLNRKYGKEHIKIIEPRTIVAFRGMEKGVPHHYFTKSELLEVFKNFRIKKLYETKRHYCLFAQKHK